jgi:acetoin utilization deacetylase AcuC-like enzyme
MSPLCLVYHQDYLASYYTSTVECPARVKAIHAKLANHFPIVEAVPAEREDILRVHTTALVERVESESRKTYETALLAAGGAIMASDEAMRGISTFGLIRPPGHHAGPDRSWGYCFFNNIAVAITRLIANGTITSAVVIDIDLHDGDGTAAIFNDIPAVNVINVKAKTRTAFLDFLEHELGNCSETDLLGISAGFDTYVLDWGGILDREDYRTIGNTIRAAAHRLCQGRCFAVLEGGYYLPDLGKNVLAFCEGLAGL